MKGLRKWSKDFRGRMIPENSKFLNSSNDAISVSDLHRMKGISEENEDFWKNIILDNSVNPEFQLKCHLRFQEA